MNKREFMKSVGVGIAAAAGLPGASSAADDDCSLKRGQIQHMVIFSLKHASNSSATAVFLKDGERILSAIPGVRGFQAFSQISKKNDFDFGFSMRFAGPAEYEAYNTHPDHVNFVEKRWKTEVSRFLEIDFKAQ